MSTNEETRRGQLKYLRTCTYCYTKAPRSFLECMPSHFVIGILVEFCRWQLHHSHTGRIDVCTAVLPADTGSSQVPLVLSIPVPMALLMLTEVSNTVDFFVLAAMTSSFCAKSLSRSEYLLRLTGFQVQPPLSCSSSFHIRGFRRPTR